MSKEITRYIYRWKDDSEDYLGALYHLSNKLITIENNVPDIKWNCRPQDASLTKRNLDQAFPFCFLAYKKDIHRLLTSDGSYYKDMTEQKLTLVSFINAINDSNSAEALFVRPDKIKDEPSRWNAKCHCGADAYDSGFSVECSRGCK